MLGIVFTEFLEMVDSHFSPAIADEMLERSNLPSGGVYAATGNYDHREIIAMVGTLSRLSSVPVDELVQIFGKHLFGQFHQRYPELFIGIHHALDFLEGIEEHIHTEVLKLYPQAELPRFSCERLAPNQLVMNYSSTRPFSNLAYGLIQGCSALFEEPLDIECENLSVPEEHRVRFTLTRRQS
jgi:hypothetical protein